MASASITYAAAPTVEEILRACDVAYVHSKQLRAQYDFVGAADAETISIIEDDIYSDLAQTYQDINRTYPIILAAMSAGSYDRRAAKLFFKYVRDHPWKDMQEFYDVQSVYSSILYRLSHGRTVTRADISSIRAQTRDAMQQVGDSNNEYVERIKIMANATNTSRAKARARELISYTREMRAILIEGQSKPIVVSVEED